MEVVYVSVVTVHTSAGDGSGVSYIALRGKQCKPGGAFNELQNPVPLQVRPHTTRRQVVKCKIIMRLRDNCDSAANMILRRRITQSSSTKCIISSVRGAHLLSVCGILGWLFSLLTTFQLSNIVLHLYQSVQRVCVCVRACVRACA